MLSRAGVHICSLGTWEAKVESLQIPGDPELLGEFKANLSSWIQVWGGENQREGRRARTTDQNFS